MGRNHIEAISGKLFSNISNLLSLDLTMNKISQVVNQLPNATINRKIMLFLISHQIADLAFANLYNLEELLLGQNSIYAIPDGLFFPLKKMKKLMLFSNNIIRLEKDDFDGLVSLTNLMLNNNLLNSHHFHQSVFNPLLKLEKL